MAGGAGARKTLVIGQIALALVLLIGAGLFVRTLTTLRARGPGFSTTNLLKFRVQPSRNGYTAAQSKSLVRNLLISVRSLPEVESAGVVTAELLSGGSWNQRLTIASGRSIVTDDVVHCNSVSPGFFETLGTPLLSGRAFNERDSQEGKGMSFRSAIINESLAKRYFGDRNPIGVRVGLGDKPDTKADIEIVGVVKTFTYRGLRLIDDQVFFPQFEGMVNGGGFWVRTRTSSASAFSSIRGAVRQLDSTLPVMDLRTVDDQLDRTLVNERLLAILSSVFAGLATLLAVVGLYGVMSFVVSRRTREIGIRLALGASRGRTVWLVLRDTASMVAAGLTIALPAVWGLGRLIQSQLFGVAAMDGLTIAAAAALVALVALAASAIPAHRAISVSPIEALRCE